MSLLRSVWSTTASASSSAAILYSLRAFAACSKPVTHAALLRQGYKHAYTTTTTTTTITTTTIITCVCAAAIAAVSSAARAADGAAAAKMSSRSPLSFCSCACNAVSAVHVR
jgi:hypothetical protein